MRCTSCQHEVTAAAKFCEECGAPLARLAPESYTPKHLAEKILTSKSALEGERKQVTVLFADIKSSMELLATRDPEQARELLDPVLHSMMEAVHHYEGTVNQVMGDGIMALFGAPVIAAIFLVVNGGVLFVGERLRRRGGDRQLDDMSWGGALLIGLLQSTALIPGISRSGATMVGGLLIGLRHQAAAHFSFLIATPIILGAAVLEVPKILREGAHINGIAWVAGLVAGVTAFLSVAFLMQYFRRHDFEALDPFAYYCWAAGAISLGLIASE